MMGDKFGYIAQNGNYVINPTYNEATYYSDSRNYVIDEDCLTLPSYDVNDTEDYSVIGIKKKTKPHLKSKKKHIRTQTQYIFLFSNKLERQQQIDKQILTRKDKNTMNVKFSLEQKASAFDRIANEYYNANFGQLSKSDMELLMFDIYISNVINNPKYDNGTIDYNECSDYKISKDLGITQQRVNNLKIKKQLRYPIDFDWKASLAGLMKNARYDKNAQKISLNIPDPNLFLEIQNFLEEKGAFIDIQLNRKILQMRAEYFVELSLLLETEKNARK